jgi:broad specificity phosphatase PhoE
VIVLLIRHGETDWLGERLAGRLPDVHLNAKGRQQAEILAEVFKSLGLRGVYSSPLERAMETAEPTARVAGLSIRPSDLLQEVDFGELSGKKFSELREIPLWQRVHRQPSSVHYPGGESLKDVQRRSMEAIAAIQKNHDSGIVAAFSHSDTIRLALACILKMPLDAYHSLVADPGSVSIISFAKQAVRVIGINLPPGSPLPIKGD